MITYKEYFIIKENEKKILILILKEDGSGPSSNKWKYWNSKIK